MNNTEDLLRDVLADWASGVSARSDLADAVLARDRRGRRRRVLVSVLAAVVLLAGAGVLWGIAPWRAPADRLVPASPPRRADTAPPSPADFGWLPAGYSAVDASLVAPGGWQLTASSVVETAPQIVLTVSTTAIPQIRGTGKTGTTKVGGITATTYSVPPHELAAAPYGNVPPDADGATEALTYERKPGEWIRVFTHRAGATQPLGLTRDDLVRVAQRLVSRERRIADLVHIANPAGLLMAFSRFDEREGAASIGFMLTSGSPPAEQWIAGADGQRILTPVMIYIGAASVEAYSGASPSVPPLQTTRVGNRTILREGFSGLFKSAIVRYADGRSASVLVSKAMSDAALMTLASSVTPGPDLPR